MSNIPDLTQLSRANFPGAIYTQMLNFEFKNDFLL